MNAMSAIGENSPATSSSGSEEKRFETSRPDATVRTIFQGAKTHSRWTAMFSRRSDSPSGLPHRIASPTLLPNFYKSNGSIKITSKLAKSPRNTGEESRDRKKFRSFLSRTEHQLAPALEQSSFILFQEPYEETQRSGVEVSAFTPLQVTLTAQQDYQPTLGEPGRFRSVSDLDKHWRDSYFGIGAFASQQAEFDSLASSQPLEGRNFHGGSVNALPGQESRQRVFDAIHEVNPMRGSQFDHAHRGSVSTDNTTISSQRPSTSTWFSGSGSRDSMDTSATRISSETSFSSLREPSNYKSQEELQQFTESTVSFSMPPGVSVPPMNLRQPVPRSATSGLPHAMMAGLGPMAPLPNPNPLIPVTAAASTSFRRPFRPTNMLLRHIGAIEDKPNKNSNYLGDVDHQLKLPQHLNCCMWITGIPTGVEYAEFIRTIETGAVAAVNMSAPDTNHSTQGAKVIFKKPAAAEKLFRLARQHPYVRVRGQRLNVWYNHYGREEWLGHQTRYLEIESPDILDPEYWNALFGKWCRHTLVSVQELPCCRQKYRRNRYELARVEQSQCCLQAIESLSDYYMGKVTVQYGVDSCDK
jgi:hypothetical protein